MCGKPGVPFFKEGLKALGLPAEEGVDGIPFLITISSGGDGLLLLLLLLGGDGGGRCGF